MRKYPVSRIDRYPGIRCGLCRYRSTESFFVRRIGFGDEGGYGAVAIS